MSEKLPDAEGLTSRSRRRPASTRARTAGGAVAILVAFGAVGAPGASGAQTPGPPVPSHPLPAGSTIAVGDVIDLSGTGCPEVGPIPRWQGRPPLTVIVDFANQPSFGFGYLQIEEMAIVFMDAMWPEPLASMDVAPDASGSWSASVTVDASWIRPETLGTDLVVRAACVSLLELDESGLKLDKESVDRAGFEFGPFRLADPSTSTTTTPPSSSTTAASPSTTVPAVAARPVVAPPRYTG